MFSLSRLNIEKCRYAINWFTIIPYPYLPIRNPSLVFALE